MTRPFYEQAEDREREDAVAEAVARAVGLRQIRFPRASTVDRALVTDDGQVRALVEIKCRTTPIDQYPTYCVSEERIATYRLIAQRLQVPALLAVRWSDAIGVIDVRRAPPERLAERGGREDRGDARDVEPMLHWATSAFSRVPANA